MQTQWYVPRRDYLRQTPDSWAKYNQPIGSVSSASWVPERTGGSNAPVTRGSGTGAPYQNPPGEYFKSWRPGFNVGGLGWKSDWKIDVPADSEEKVKAVHFLNWFNRVLPYLSPSDMANLTQQVNNALDTLDNVEAVRYFRPLMKNTAAMSMWNTPPGRYWDRSRLEELRRISNAYWQGAADNKQNMEEWERYGQRIADLLDIILGLQRPGGEINNPGIWSGDTLTRRQRMAYNDAVTRNLAAFGRDDPFAAVLRSILYPTVSTPILNMPITAPQTWATGYPVNRYSYGISSPRYVGY